MPDIKLKTVTLHKKDKENEQYFTIDHQLQPDVWEEYREYEEGTPIEQVMKMMRMLCQVYPAEAWRITNHVKMKTKVDMQVAITTNAVELETDEPEKLKAVS